VSLEDALHAALHDTDAPDPGRSAAALRAVTDAAARSRRRGRVRRVTSVTLPVVCVAAAGLGLWTILPGGSEPPAARQAAMPELRGLREDEAWTRLRAVGLTPEVARAPDVVIAKRGLRAAGTVVDQRPLPGTDPSTADGRARIVVVEVPTPIDNLGDPVTRPMSAGMGCIPASCDELRIAAWPRQAAIRRITATIDGRTIPMRPVRGTTYWQGTLRRSGIAARLLAARGTLDGWGGAGPTIAVDVRLRIHLANGRVRGYSWPLVVRSGWG